MKHSSQSSARGFTLIETVIAIGVLAVLLTGFMMVFAPAAAGIKQSISVQDADRLASTLEHELVTLRPNDKRTDKTSFANKPTHQANGFDKAFERIKNSFVAKTSDPSDSVLMIYQYRGELGAKRSIDDGTLKPMPDISGKLAGLDYVVIPMVRQKGDANFAVDLPAIEGGLYLVRCTPLVFTNSALQLSTLTGKITDLKGSGDYTDEADPNWSVLYPESVIPFAADFYSLPAKASSYFTTNAYKNFYKNGTPVFTRNLAVRR